MYAKSKPLPTFLVFNIYLPLSNCLLVSSFLSYLSSSSSHVPPFTSLQQLSIYRSISRSNIPDRSREMSEMEAGGCNPLTTFVHADTGTFREVVQRLTGGGGSNQTQTQTQHEKSIGASAISSKRTTTSSSTSKLHERRHMRPKLEIVKPTTTTTTTTTLALGLVQILRANRDYY